MSLKQVPCSDGVIPGIGRVPVIRCFEDKAHTERAVAAIRERKARQDQVTRYVEPLPGNDIATFFR